MATRFLTKPRTEIIDPWNISFPVDALWGIYARQSTPGQLINHIESTEMQTDDLILWLQHRNVRDNYVLFDADLGMSGTLRIDQRPALQELIRRINADEIKAVLVYQISRLFRDLTGIQYNTFADDCKKHHCILVTAFDGMVYNFNNPIHMKMFRFLAETAAEYLQQQIGLLHEARLRKARKGLYVSLGRVPSGFIVDYDKDSPTFKKIVSYEEHRDVILDSLYRRYYSLCGDFSALCREIDSMPYVFPLFEPWVDRRILNQWNKRLQNNGYSLTRKGIITVMTNPANIGWWIVAGDIISKSNHDPLIPPEEQYLFWYAFERLAPYTVDGEKNELRINDHPKRFYQRHTNPTEGLLKDRASSPDGVVRVHMKQGSQHYAIVPPNQRIYITDMHEIDARLIDPAFAMVFLAHLKETPELEIYQKWVTTEMQNHEALLANLESQLRNFDKSQDAILSEIVAIRTHITETATTEEEKKQLEKEAAPLLQGLREKYNTLEKTKKEVSDKLQSIQTSEHYTTMKQYASFQVELAKLIPVWEQKPFSIKKEFINLCLSEAVIQIIAPHWIQLDMYWSHPQWQPQQLFIPRPRGPRDVWTEEEKARFQEQYPTAPKDTLLQLFPGKNWAALLKMAEVLGIRRTVSHAYPVPLHLSWDDMLFMKENNISLDTRSPILAPLSLQSAENGIYLKEDPMCPNSDILLRQKRSHSHCRR